MMFKHDTFKRGFYIISRLAFIVGLVVIVLPLLAAPSDLDATWGGDGIVEVDFDGNGDDDSDTTNVITDHSGKTLVVGRLKMETTQQIGVMRLKKNGQPDPTFGENGRVVVPPPPPYNFLGIYVWSNPVAIQSNGKIILAGITGTELIDGDIDTFLVLVRLNANGSIDSSFGDNGYVQFSPLLVEFGTHENSNVVAVVVDPSDRIVLTGNQVTGTNNPWKSTVSRFTKDGTLDISYGENGIIEHDEHIMAIALQRDGKPVIAQSAYETRDGCEPSSIADIIRLNVDGSVDTSFGEQGGHRLTPNLWENGMCDYSAYVHTLTVAPDQSISLAGQQSGYEMDGFIATNGAFFAKLDSQGMLDPTFDDNGILIQNAEEESNFWYLRFFHIILQADGKPLVTTEYEGSVPNSYQIRLSRYQANGSPDTSWHPDREIVITTGPVKSPLMALQDDGRILAVVSSNTSETASNYVYRYTGDPAFGYTALSPQHRQKQVSTKANLKLTFPKSVTVNTGKIEIRRVSDFSLFESIPVTDSARLTGGGTNTIIINPSVDFEQNTKYYVLVDPNTFTNASGHPFSGVRELTEWHFTTELTNFVLNAGFEGKGNKATRPATWTVNNLTSADRRICNVERDGKPDLIYAHSGKCAFRFQSGVVKARNIQQEIVLIDAFADQTLNLNAFVRTNTLTSGAKVQVMLTYADDSKQTVNLNVPRGTKPYRKLQKSFVLPKDAASARVRIITGTSKGTLLIDDLSLTISEATALPMAIPLPAAQDLRGN